MTEFPFTPIFDEMLDETKLARMQLGELPGWGKVNEAEPAGVGAPDAAGDRGTGADVPPAADSNRAGQGELPTGPAPGSDQGDREAGSDSGGQR